MDARSESTAGTLGLRRRWLSWEGALPVPGSPRLVVRGGLIAPHPAAVALCLAAAPRWDDLVREASRAVAAEDGEDAGALAPCHVLVERAGAAWVFEIGLEAEGDPEHVRGARFVDLRLVGVSGSVPGP